MIGLGGTIVYDLERRRPIRPLPDREPTTACGSWDRGGGYALAAAQAPHAQQVADALAFDERCPPAAGDHHHGRSHGHGHEHDHRHADHDHGDDHEVIASFWRLSLGLSRSTFTAHITGTTIASGRGARHRGRRCLGPGDRRPGACPPLRLDVDGPRRGDHWRGRDRQLPPRRYSGR